MIRLYSERRVLALIDGLAPTIRALAAKYPVEEAQLRAVLLREMREIDLLDLAADAAVSFYWLRVSLRRALCRLGLARSERPLIGGPVLGKKDSSTGWAQVYGFVAVDSIIFAAERGLTTAGELGLPGGRLPERGNDGDLRTIWRRLRRDRAFNLELCALTLLASAEERIGRADLSSPTADELKRAFTRYNGRVPGISPYGEETYGLYLKFLEAGRSTSAVSPRPRSSSSPERDIQRREENSFDNQK